MNDITEKQLEYNLLKTSLAYNEALVALVELQRRDVLSSLQDKLSTLSHSTPLCEGGVRWCRTTDVMDTKLVEKLNELTEKWFSVTSDIWFQKGQLANLEKELDTQRS